MTEVCSQEQFEKDIATHVLTIEQDDGLYRRLRFSRPESIVYWFDIVTWPGVLCISGDMGTYVFSRISDMFEFFRGEKINPGYWGEKLLAIGTNAGYKEFSEKEFRDRVQQYFDSWKEAEEPGEDDAKSLWDAIEDAVLSKIDDGEHWAYTAAYDFSHKFSEASELDDFHFQDFFDGGATEDYTYHYIWNLRAIVWAIQQYDKVKSDGI